GIVNCRLQTDDQPMILQRRSAVGRDINARGGGPGYLAKICDAIRAGDNNGLRRPNDSPGLVDDFTARPAPTKVYSIKINRNDISKIEQGTICRCTKYANRLSRLDGNMSQNFIGQIVSEIVVSIYCVSKDVDALGHDRHCSVTFFY